MNDISSDIGNTLKQKIQLLVVALEYFKQENEQLKVRNAELEEKLKAEGQAGKALEERNSLLNVANAFSESVTDPHEAKIKVNRLVREIDKCIALLNK
ncbi:MAG TPA: hypothetical protein PLA24_11320 [Tenuifilaceae bacterium]|nr:hypothetical protein [Tenuifilaceae bacterium]HRX32406.1 hypothetical protein [Tenuifilaceae bacterium]